METLESTSRLVEGWYESFRSSFIKMGLKLGYKKEELDDIVNQFFLDILEKRIDLHSIKSPQAYLSTAFRRKLIDHYRSSVKTLPVVDAESVSEKYAVPPAQDIFEKVHANTELIRQIRTAYKKLPNRCQKVIYLKFYKGLSTEQIARQSGLSKRTVYNNLFEGIKLLRKELNLMLPDFQFVTLLSVLPFLTTFTTS